MENTSKERNMSTFQKIIQWMIQSAWFHKYNALIGAFCSGLWVQAHYWKQIASTLDVWGIPHNEYMATLVLLIGLSGIGVSILGTVIKNTQAEVAAKVNKDNKDNPPAV